MKTSTKLLICFCFAATAVAQTRGHALGIFNGHSDVGETPKRGSATYDSATGEYRITGGGANIWGTTDAFQFVWKRMSGDVTLTADVRFLGVGKEDHRKAVLMIRQGLEPDSPYADIALHGDGLTSLQFRRKVGAETEEVQSPVKAPLRIRIERRGDQFTMYTGSPSEELKPSGTANVPLKDPVYVGIGVSSHEADVLETAVLSNVTVDSHAPSAAPEVRSKISVYDLATKSVKVIYEADRLFEAPNWSGDGKSLIANSGGKLFRIALSGFDPIVPEKLAIPDAYEANNDHGFSQDGKSLAISADTASSQGSQVFLTLPDGSNPRLLTPKEPSYFHAWAPDGRWLAFVGERNNNFDIFRVSSSGGEEQRLTSNAGYDDGPDYSPDGNWIYFNSDRSGSWDIWRMPTDGAGPGDQKAEQVTNDELEDWFPHPSPDGKWLVFLSFPKGTKGHDYRLEIELRMMTLPGVKMKTVPIQVLAKVFGGQGTINVNSWSPDSSKFAFVSYEIK
jgi:dipeptidyl aminopeptidase/acylaminoacyl peptidase